VIEVSPDDFEEIVIGVDPAVTSGEDADETGIIVAARGPHQPDTCVIPHCRWHAYILEDATLPKSNKSSPDRWGRRVIEAYDQWNASVCVVESNQGKELLRSVLQNIRPDLPVELPHAGVSKEARAEPIVALYEQGRVHHIGDPIHYALLEDQMTTWVPTGKRGRVSPDRMDALVWAVTRLDINGTNRKVKRSFDGMVPLGFGQQNGWAI
jgi:phage terminase large subunit-like protein